MFCIPGQSPRASVGVQGAINPWALLPGHSHAERVADGLIRAEHRPRAAVWSCRYVPLFIINTKGKAAKKQWGHTGKESENGALQTEQRMQGPCLRCIFQLHSHVKLEKLPQHLENVIRGRVLIMYSQEIKSRGVPILFSDAIIHAKLS